MNTVDTDFFRAFAGRVRTQLATTTREGDPTVTTQTTAETTEVSALPATFEATPDAPCEAHAWCIEQGAHIDHISREVSLPTSEGRPPILTAHLYTDRASGAPTLDFDPGHDDWQEYTSGDQLREQTAKVRAHLTRLDAFADQYDAIREATAARNAEASLAEHGGTPEQFAAMAEIKRILGLPVPYIVPTEYGEAARVTAAGARGAILNAYVFGPDEDEPDAPTLLSVYSEPNEDAELDLAGARDLRAQLVEFLPKLDAMIDALAAAEQDGAR